MPKIFLRNPTQKAPTKLSFDSAAEHDLEYYIGRTSPRTLELLPFLVLHPFSLPTSIVILLVYPSSRFPSFNLFSGIPWKRQVIQLEQTRSEPMACRIAFIPEAAEGNSCRSVLRAQRDWGRVWGGGRPGVVALKRPFVHHFSAFVFGPRFNNICSILDTLLPSIVAPFSFFLAYFSLPVLGIQFL